MTTSPARRRGRRCSPLGVAGCGGSSLRRQRGRHADADRAKEVSPAGDIPDNQAFVAYAPPGAGYSVKVPEGWSRTRAGGAVDVHRQAQLHPHRERAARRAERRRASRPSCPARAGRHGFEPAASAPSAQARHGVRITYLGAEPARPGDRQDAHRRGRALRVHRTAASDVVLTLSGPKGADNVDPWRIVTDSLRWTA